MSSSVQWPTRAGKSQCLASDPPCWQASLWSRETPLFWQQLALAGPCWSPFLSCVAGAGIAVDLQACFVSVFDTWGSLSCPALSRSACLNKGSTRTVHSLSGAITRLVHGTWGWDWVTLQFCPHWRRKLAKCGPKKDTFWSFFPHWSAYSRCSTHRLAGYTGSFEPVRLPRPIRPGLDPALTRDQ